MKSIIRLRLSLIFLLFFPAAVSAGGLDRFLGHDTFLLVEYPDVPGYSVRLEASPLGQAIQHLDLPELIVQAYIYASDSMRNPNEPAAVQDPEVVRELLHQWGEEWNSLRTHFNGSLLYTIGGVTGAVNTIMAVRQQRSELPLLDPDEPAPAERLALEEALNTAELSAILSPFSLWIEITDAEGLQTKLAGLASAFEQKVAADIQFLTHTDDDGQRLFALLSPEFSENAGLFWALTDELLIVAHDRNTLRGHLHALQTPPELPLSESPLYKESKAAVTDADGFFYFAPYILDGLLRDHLPDFPPPVAGIPGRDALLDWLGLDAFLPYAMGSSLEDSSIYFRARYGFTRETSLSRIVLDPTDRPAPLPDFLHRDVEQVTTSHWHLGEGWTRLQQELTAFSPQAAAGLGMMRMLATGQLGFDILMQFLDHLDSGWVLQQSLDLEVFEAFSKLNDENMDHAEALELSMSHPTGGQNFLIGFELRNREPIEAAMQRLLNRFSPGAPAEPELYADHEVFFPIPESFQGAELARALSYTLTDTYLLVAVGRPEPLFRALDALADPDLRLANQPWFPEMRAQFPEHAQTFSYASGAQQRQGIEMMKYSLELLNLDGAFKLPDLEPLAGLVERSVSTTMREGLVIEQESRVFLNPLP